MKACYSLATLLCGLAALLPAQGSFQLHRTLPGSLGDNLQFTYSGIAQSVLVLACSASSGVLPLPPAVSNRPLDLGPNPILLVEAATVPSGNTTPIPVPNTPSLAGLLLHWQAVTFPGSPQLLDAISNRVVTQIAVVAVPTLLRGTGSGLAWSAFVPWPDASGATRMLFAGGGDRTTISTVPQSSSMVFNCDTLEVAPGPAMPTAVYGMTATQLLDGRTLLAGGIVQNGSPPVDRPTTAACLFDPLLGQFLPLPPMATQRALHAAARLPDGRVVVVGGTMNLVFPNPAALSSVEVFDPQTLTWSPGPSLPQAWLWGALSALPTGDLLLHGGFAGNITLAVATSCRRLVLGSGGALAWTSAPAMNTPRVAHADGTLLLDDGRLLVAGGAIGLVLFGIPLMQASNLVEVFDPMANTWTSILPMPNPSFGGSIHQLPNGSVVYAGGLAGMLAPTPVSGIPSPYVSIWDLSTGAWSSGPAMQQPRMLHRGGTTPDGVLVLFGGHQLAGSGAGNYLIETIR